MGFFSWKCSKTGVSIPHDYRGEVILITPKGSYRGIYDGYGRLRNLDGEINIMPQVGEDMGIIKHDEDMWADGWVVEDKNGTQYIMRVDFEDFGKHIVDSKGAPLFDGKSVNELVEDGTVKRKVSLYQKIVKEVRIVVGYAYNGVTDTFETLEHSENCPHQGFFYPEDFNSYPTDYHKESANG